MKKFKLFVDNFLIYGFGGIISKVIPFIMLPVITRLMPDSTYFGIYDLSNTILEFGKAIAILGMYDAMFRMFFEKQEEDFKKKVCSTAMLFTLMMSVSVSMIMMLSREFIAHLFMRDSQYSYLICITALATLVGATNGIISAPTRMQNKRKVFLVTNITGPILSYMVSIPLILKGYFVIALPLGAVISGVTLEITFGILNHKWFHPGYFDLKLLKTLLYIAIPTVPCFLAYWIFGSFDRLMITNMIGLGAAGIYSVGGKLGQASQLIYTAFAGGWQYFAFSTMKEENQTKSNSLVFEYLGVIAFIASMFMSAWSYTIFKLLFVGEYIEGYVVAPYLFLAPLLQMLFQVAVNQFLVVKKTWPIPLILSCGAALNIEINFMLIPVLGIEGAAIATLLGYAASVIIVCVVLSRMKLFVPSKRFIIVSAVMAVFLVGWRLYFKESVLTGTMAAAASSLICAMLYKGDLAALYRGIKRE